MKKIIVLLVVAAMMLSVFAGCAKKGPDFTIGIAQYMEHVALDSATKGFIDAVEEGMKAAGKTVQFDSQNAQGEASACTTIIGSFVSNKYSLIMANATPCLLSAISATTEIPILGTSVTSYDGIGNYVEGSTDGTGINASGTSDGVPAALYANLTLDVVPDAKTVVVYYCSAEPNSKIQADNYIAAMAEINPAVECKVATFSDSNDMQPVLTGAIVGADAVYIPTDNTAANNMTNVANVCEPAKMPVICGESGMCLAGGLATCSISYYDLGYRTGEMACEILLKGADVSTMTIRYAEASEPAYNPEFAEVIGMTMPEGYTVLSAE